CPAHFCEELLEYAVDAKCVGCGACKRICPAGAITGAPKSKHDIDQAKCVKCGACYKICKFKAITRQ
ncbi:MAG: 4Fe-4S binding protein, partial [Candidatus Omnitrophota bacterium]